MKSRLFCVAAALTLVPVAVWADCVGGSRPNTAEEREFARRLSESLKAAMPAAPAPLTVEREPEVILGGVCKDTPAGQLGALATTNYVASTAYNDRVKLTIRANYEFYGKSDEVLGTLPKKPAGFKVHNLVVSVDGYKPQYIEAVKQAVDRARLQTLIDQPLPEMPAPAAWSVGASPRTVSAAAPASAPIVSSDSAPATAAQPAAPAAPPPQASPQPDVAQQAKDTVNKLRGLLGR